MYKKLGMQSELHRNNVYQSVELLLLVTMLFLLAIPKILLILSGWSLLLKYAGDLVVLWHTGC